MSHFRLIFLGAGFSHGAGLPLGEELWRVVRTRAGDSLESDLATYIQYRKECDGLNLAAKEVDFEELLAFLDIEHHLGLAGGDSLGLEGNETQVMIKRLIGQVLTERTPPAHDLPQIYYDFAEQLGQGDYILTFNYDVLLERALDHVGKPYRLFPARHECIRPGYGVVDSSRDENEVVVLKLHGSVDWFDRSEYEELLEESTSPEHPVFGPDSSVEIVPLLEGPQFPDDPLRSVWRVISGLERLYSDPALWRAVPRLVNPSTAKAVYAKRSRYLWWDMGRAGEYNLGVAVIGYSLPRHDDYVRQALFRVTKNFQENWWDADLAGKKKSPMLLIDRQADEAGRSAYRARYGFVDERKARFYFGGFDAEALRLLRDGQQHRADRIGSTAGDPP